MIADVISKPSAAFGNNQSVLGQYELSMKAICTLTVASVAAKLYKIWIVMTAIDV